MLQGCEFDECDCERLAVTIALAAGVAALAISVIAKNRLAAREAQRAIQKAMRTARGQSLRDLETADGELQVIDSDLQAVQQQWEQLLDKLRQAESNSFGSSGSPVIIQPPA